MSTVTGLTPARFCSTCWLSASVSAAARVVTASGSPTIARTLQSRGHRNPASIQPPQRARPGASARRGCRAERRRSTAAPTRSRWRCRVLRDLDSHVRRSTECRPGASASLFRPWRSGPGVTADAGLRADYGRAGILFRDYLRERRQRQSHLPFGRNACWIYLHSAQFAFL